MGGGGGMGRFWRRQTSLFSPPVLSQRVEPLLQQRVLFLGLFVLGYWLPVAHMFVYTDKPFKMNE